MTETTSSPDHVALAHRVDIPRRPRLIHFTKLLTGDRFITGRAEVELLSDSTPVPRGPRGDHQAMVWGVKSGQTYAQRRRLGSRATSIWVDGQDRSELMRRSTGFTATGTIGEGPSVALPVGTAGSLYLVLRVRDARVDSLWVRFAPRNDLEFGTERRISTPPPFPADGREPIQWTSADQVRLLNSLLAIPSPELTALAALLEDGTLDDHARAMRLLGDLAGAAIPATAEELVLSLLTEEEPGEAADVVSAAIAATT